jgi:hypothetical protein
MWQAYMEFDEKDCDSFYPTEPIIKFNDGDGAILCKRCFGIVKEGLTKKEASGDTDVLICETCKEELG